MKKTDIVYRVGSSLYVNVTNRCSNSCSFCIAQYGPKLWGYYLRFPTPQDEPNAEELFAAISAEADFTELVFCGLGEPWLRIETIIELLEKLNLPRSKVRMNTNGHGLMLGPHSALERLAQYVSTLSVSLNAPNAKSYVEVCQPKFGEKSFAAILEFILKTKEFFKVTATAVASSEVDLLATEKLALSLGVAFKRR